MKIVLEHSDIQKAIAAHVAAIGYSIHPDDVQIEQLDDGTFEAPLSGVEFNPGTNAMTTPVVDKPKQTRAKRTPKVEPTAVTGVVKAEEVDSAVDEATLAAYRQKQAAANQQPAIDVPVVSEAPDNITVPKATAGTVSEAQTAAVVDRMLAEEPTTEDGSAEEATTLPTAAQLTATKPSGFLRKKLEAQQAAAQAQSE